MTGSRRGTPTGIVAGALAAFLAVAPASGQEPGSVEHGESLYRSWCMECHGEDGTGDGPAAHRMLPRPRDFTRARYQVRTTGSGELPTEADLMRVLEEGLPGTTMPAWPNLSRDDRRDLVAYLESLSRFFEGASPEAMDFGEDPGGGEEAIAAGREAWKALECAKCHGEEGRGYGPSAPTLEDWRELPIRAADLTEPWLFNGGSSVEDIHRRFLTGLDGTPMPAYSDALAADVVTAEQLWGLAHYVRSLAPERVPPKVRDVILVRRVEDSLPTAPDDAAWDGVEEYYVPLAGQVVQQPRAWAPRVDGIWASGLHDGREVVLRIRWSDPSESPDSTWTADWQSRIAGTLDPDGTPVPTDPLPDRLFVQFPPTIPEERELPYFLMGGRQRPVYLWRWSSEEGASEGRATGLGTDEPLPDAAGLTGAGVWNAGQWTVTLRRALDTETEGALSLREGAPIPVAFFAWDGSDGETGKRGSLSSWYFVHLEPPPSRAVYLIPALAMLLTGGLGLFAASRARRRHERGTKS